MTDTTERHVHAPGFPFRASFKTPWRASYRSVFCCQRTKKRRHTVERRLRSDQSPPERGFCLGAPVGELQTATRRGERQALRAAYEIQDENDQQDDHKNPNDAIARSGNSKRHVPSFVVFRLSVSISSSS